jgi:asparagine synthase (glutamine-hydrolysing)
VALVQRRLAIIDLKTGDQPLYAPCADGAADGGAEVALIANAEIYNYVELRQALIDAHGTNFRTNSDCETPLHLYLRHGTGFAAALRGMYAIAIHDPAAGRLVLARDPFGIKPLYIAEGDFGLAFASEPQALVAAGLVMPRVDAERRAELLQLQFTTGRGTPLHGIERVLPGETLVVEGGRIVARHRRAALPEGGPVEAEADPEAALDRVLADSVLLHQRSDVPYAMFLSGGVDSSALLALMARLNPQPVCAYTAGFPDTGARDERAHARTVAKAAGAEHVEIAFTEADFWAVLPQIAAAMDDPAADYAILPSWALAQEARKDFKVVLCGEGGDELFAGYGRYRSVLRPTLLGGRPLRRRGTFDRLDVLRPDALGDKGCWRGGLAAAEAIAREGGRSRLQAAQALDCADWLPNDLLTKLDRCLMAHGVEGRTPFLDPEVAAATFRLPDRLKLNNGTGKWLLRQWLARHLPTAKPFGKKRGFTVPVADWIARRGKAIGPLVARQPGVAEVAVPDAVTALFAAPGLARDKRRGFAAWTLLFYALWHRRHIEGKLPDGDVAACLTA